MRAVTTMAPAVGIKPVCEALGISRASLYRRRLGNTVQKAPKPSPRALSSEEKQQVLEVLHSDRFVDKPP